MPHFLLFLLLALVTHLVVKIREVLLKPSPLTGRWREPKRAILKQEEHRFLVDFVPFYKSLDSKKQELFGYKMLEFLTNVKIVGVRTKVSGEDKLLIACSAIIPVLHFPDWKYTNLKVIFLHPRTMLIHGKKVVGLVGEGVMKDKMLLSKEALHFGFRYGEDQRHTALHEFIHLIDMADGKGDGIPELLMKEPQLMPWYEMMNEKLSKIAHSKNLNHISNHNQRAELLSSLSEYFFERPMDFKKEDPELYKKMEQLFNPHFEEN